MKIKAEMITESKNPQAVAMALDADNKQMPGISVFALDDGRIRTEVSAETVGSLISTLDDVVCCQMGAEKVMMHG